MASIIDSPSAEREGTPLDVPVRQVLHQVTGAVAASGATIALAAGSEGPLFITEAVGYPPTLVESWQPIPIDAPVPLSDAFRRGVPVFSPDTGHAASRYPGLVGRPLAGHRARAVIPLVASTEEVLGVVGFSYAEPQPFDDDQREQLLAAADAVARCVQHHLFGDESGQRGSEAIADLVVTVDVASALMGDEGDLNPEEIERRICYGARAICASDTAALWSAEADGLRLRAMVANRPWPADTPQVLAEGLSGIRRFWAAIVERRVEYVSSTGHGRLPDDAERQLMERFGVHAALRVPLALPGGHAGILTLMWRDPPARPPTVSTTFAVRRFARLATAALHRAEHQRSADALRSYVETLRLAFAPPTLPQPRGFDVAARLLAPVDGFTGDFYDLFALPSGDWVAVMGDVAGHGHQAAAVAVQARHTIRAAAFGGMTSEAVMQLANDAALGQAGSDLFATAAFCRLSRRNTGVNAQITRAGHPYPLVRRRDGSVHEVARSSGDLLGVFDRVRPALDLVVLDPGDTLILYTDGLVERRSGNRELGIGGVKAALARLGRDRVSARAIVDLLLEEVERFDAAPPADDVAVMALRVT